LEKKKKRREKAEENLREYIEKKYGKIKWVKKLKGLKAVGTK
jgi:hypothetical protein